MTSAQIEGRRPVVEALRAGRKVTEILLTAGARPSGVLAEILNLAERHAIPVRRLERRDLEARAQSRNPQGVIALASGFAYGNLGDVLERASALAEPPLLVAADGITDPQNLGALARSAEAAGADALLVPRRRAAGVTPATEKASAGALEHLDVVQVANLARALEELKGAGIWIVAMDAASEQTIYELELADQPLCLVVGAESGGVSRLVKDRADRLVSIPMAGRVASLNASAAAAVALFEVRRRRAAR